MIRFEKMTKKDFIVFCVASVFGGIMVAIGGVGLLISMSKFEGAMGSLVGSIIFSLAMFVVTAFGLYLTTGLSTRILTMGIKNMWSLPVSLVFNVIGIGIVALLVRFSHVDVINTATNVMNNKLCSQGWVLHSICSGILCGILIGLSVLLGKHSSKKNLSASVGVTFPIIVFVFCGFDNSLANVYYMFMCNNMTWSMVGYCFLSLFGNLLGGVLISIMPLIKRKEEPKKYKCPCCGFYTFEHKNHEYEICPVCYWEDDPVQLKDPTFKGGANHVSLEKARENYKKFEACEHSMKKFVRKPRKNEQHGYDR
ncbi:MAG: formate/nitrite transporter family protein [Clostridia bacterium]|nr:formate/nitrite transporter family protein [Clostridia bacterium]